MRMFILLKTDYTFSLTDHRHKSTVYILFAIYNLIQQQDILCRTIFSRPHWPSRILFYTSATFSLQPRNSVKLLPRMYILLVVSSSFRIFLVFFHPPLFLLSLSLDFVCPRIQHVHVSFPDISIKWMNFYFFFPNQETGLEG